MRKDEKRFLKLTIFSFLLIEAIVAGVLIYTHYYKYHYFDKGEVIAEINGEKIYSEEIYSRMKFLSDKFNRENLKIEDLNEEILKAILLEQYMDKKIIELAKKNGIYENNQYKFLANEYYENLVREYYLNKFVFGSVTEDLLEKKYDELVEKTKDKEERKISHILVETEGEAERIRNTILRRNNFERMAKDRSLDTATAINGGSIGYVIKEELAHPEFANVAFLLKKGELSRPIQTKEGWHIIRVDDIRNIQIKSFEDSKEDIYNNLTQEAFLDFMNRFIDTENIDKSIKLFINTNKELENTENTEEDNEENTDNSDNRNLEDLEEEPEEENTFDGPELVEKPELDISEKKEEAYNNESLTYGNDIDAFLEDIQYE